MLRLSCLECSFCSLCLTLVVANRAHQHDPGTDLGRCRRNRRGRRMLQQGGGKGDQGQHERSAPVVVRTLLDHGRLAGVFQPSRRLFQS